MIFKTFDSNIDKISSKWGMFGRSFNDIGTAIIGRITDINKAFQATDDLIGSIKDSDSIWKRLYSSKESIKEQLIDVDMLIPEIDKNKFDFDGWINRLNAIDKQVKAGTLSWQDYSNGLKDNQKWIAKWGQETEGQIRTQSDIVKANQQARASALAHNEAIKAQTFSAKAGKVALQALATAGNMLAMWAISKVIFIVATKIDDLAHSAEHCAERVDELMSNYQSALDKANSNAKTVEDLSSRYEELSKGVNNLGQNILLTTDEYSEYNNIVNQIADMFPTLIQGYTNEGNAILSLKGNVEQLRDAYKEAQQEAYNMLIISGEDSDGNDIITNYRNTIFNDNPFVKLDSVAQEYIDVINSFHEAMLTSDESYNQFYKEMITNRKLINEYDMSAKQFDKIKNVLDDIGFKSELSDDDKRNISNGVKAYIQTYQAEINNALSGIHSLANAYLMTNEDYAELDDNAKTATSLIVNSIDIELANGFEGKTDVGAYVSNIASIIKDNPDVSNALNGLFTTDFNSLSYDDAKAIIDQYINTIAELTKRDPIELKAILGFSEYDDNENLVNNVKEKLQNEFDDKVGELTLAELKIAAEQVEVPNGTLLSWDELTAKIKEVKNSLPDNETLSTSQTIDQLNTQLKPTFDALKSAYQDIFTDDGFTLENVDLSMLDSIKSKMDELNENKELGISIDYSSFDNLARVLTDTSSESDDVQKAFDSFATSVLNSTSVIDDMDESTVQLVASMLESMGVANADEVAYETLNAKMEGLALQEQLLAETGKELADVTADDAVEFLKHAGASDIARTYLFQLVAAEQVFNAQGLDISGKIEKLKELATAYGQTALVAKIAHMEDQNAKSHTSFTDSDYQTLVDEVNNAVNNVHVDFGNIGGGSKSAASAGRESADAYLEAFEKELSELDDLKNRGEITEKQYLDALRKLYLKYFRDKEKYLKEYKKYEQQYLEGMKSLYESAFSYITKQIDKRISALGDEKDAAVSALEAERDARLEAIEVQKEQLENEIEGIEKEIESKDKEIKAMQDANEERRRAIDLQKKEYELQRMQNQRTSLVYKGGQMAYEADASGIRDAKQEVENAKLEIDISKIEKEIDLLENQKNLLREQIDLLDQEADQINEYYDRLITNTEMHYDAMIKGLEDYKSQFEELTDLLENARLEATLAELGINMDALLSGSQEEFGKLKTAYIGILADMSRGNDGVLDQLSRLSGISAESISYLDATKGAFEGLASVTMEGLTNSIDGVAKSADNISTSAGEASAAIDNMQTNVSNASQNIAPLNTELGNLKILIDELIELLNSIKFPEIGDDKYVQKLNDTAQAFGKIASKCDEFKNIDFASIIGTSSAPNTEPGGTAADMESQPGTGFLGLASAISNAVTSISEQMVSLQTALQTGNDSFTEQIRIITEEYIPAWENLQTRLAEIIGIDSGGGPESELRAGKHRPKEEGSEPGGNDGSIIGIMQAGGEAVSKKLENPWLKAFHDFATEGDNSIRSICNKIIEMVREMADTIQQQCAAAAQALDNLAQKTSILTHSEYGSNHGGGGKSRGGFNGIVGNALAKGTTVIESLPTTGYQGLPRSEKNVLRSEYGQTELTVYPDGKTELTTEPVMSDLPKETVIFNAKQTKRIMENEGSVIGNTHSHETITTKDGAILRPLNESDETYWMMKRFDEYFSGNRDAFLKPANAIFDAAESMNRIVETVNHNNTLNRTAIHIGDIHLHEVQDINTLSKELTLRFPNKLLQEINK